MTEAELQAEKARLERLFALRKGRLGFSENVKAIQAQLDQINGQIAQIPAS